MPTVDSIYPNITAVNAAKGVLQINCTWDYDDGSDVNTYTNGLLPGASVKLNTNAETSNRADYLVSFTITIGGSYSPTTFVIPQCVNNTGLAKNGTTASSIILVIGETLSAPSYSTHPYDAAIWYLLRDGEAYRYVQSGENAASAIPSGTTQGVNCTYYIGLTNSTLDPNAVYTMGTDNTLQLAYPAQTNSPLVFTENMANWLSSVSPDLAN